MFTVQSEKSNSKKDFEHCFPYVFNFTENDGFYPKNNRFRLKIVIRADLSKSLKSLQTFNTTITHVYCLSMTYELQ